MIRSIDLFKNLCAIGELRYYQLALLPTNDCRVYFEGIRIKKDAVLPR
jgi:hypothetical protein